MDIRIRLEQPSDYREAEQVVREAFWNYYSPGCVEHYLLHVMRHSPNFVRDLDFVAVASGKVVGIVVFQKAFILGDDGNRYEVLTMGPIAVLPDFQRQGVGRMLIVHARAAAAGGGYRAIVLCGEPRYYPKVGFMAAAQFGIRTSDNKYAAALHVCPLHEGALQGLSGRYYEDEIYGVAADEEALAAFDAGFPFKERLADTPTQRRFAEVLAMQSDYEG